jgi:hypothetical protein
MKRVSLVLIGAGLGWLAMALSVYAFGLLAVWSPFPLGLWKSHGPLVIRLSALLTSIPFALLLALVLRRLFSAPSRVLFSSLSMLIAFLVAYADTFRGAHPFQDLGVTAELSIPFLLGVPALVYLLENRRGLTNAWSGRESL